LTFSEWTTRSVSSPKILLEIDISSLNAQWVNAGAGIWKVNFDNSYPEVDATLLDGFSSQTFTNIGSVQIDAEMLTKVSSLLLVSSTYKSFYYDRASKTLYISIINYDAPFLHTILLGVVSGFSKEEFSPLGSGSIYEGRLLQVPSVGLTRDPLYFGKISYPSVSISLINTDGAYDSFADTYNIYGNAARIYFGYTELNYTDYQLVYSGYIEKITISEDEVSVAISDKRKQLKKKIYYSCTDKNALDAITEVLAQAYPGISYTASYYDITNWEIAKALVDNITIVPNIGTTEEVITIIENICKSVFGLFIINPDGKYTFKLIDNSATASTTISQYDILTDPLEINYDPSEVLSSIRVSYNQVISKSSTDYKTWLTDTDYESAVYLKYKTYVEQDFDTYLNTQADANSFADKVMTYAKDVHGELSIEVPMKYYLLEFGGVVNCEINRETTTMLGTKKCEILGKTYNLENETINLDLRIV
jgi:hypothetical protein